MLNVKRLPVCSAHENVLVLCQLFSLRLLKFHARALVPDAIHLDPKRRLAQTPKGAHGREEVAPS